MKQPERMTPTEYVDFMWDEFNKAVGGDDLARWRESGRVSSIKFPFDNLLTPEIILDRGKAFTNAIKKYSGIEGMWRDATAAPIRMVMNHNDRALCNEILVALFPTFTIDASLRSTPRGDRIILLHVAINDFLARLLLPVAGMIMGREIDKSEIKQLISDLRAIWHCLDASPKQPPKSEREAFVFANLMLAATQFIVGHEYGHAIKGHKSYTDVRSRNHEMEYEADGKGTDLLFKVWASGTQLHDNMVVNGASESRPIFALVAPCAVLGGFALLNKSATHTHPSPIDRMERFVSRTKLYIPEKHTWSFLDLDQYQRALNVFKSSFSEWSRMTR